MKSLLFALALLLSFGCQKSVEKNTQMDIDVLVNIAPYAYFVEKITGGLLRTETLIPEGINPHVYEPTPKQVTQVRSARVWFRLGEPQENKILKILQEQNPSLLQIDLCKNISLLPLKEHSCSSDGHGLSHDHNQEGRDRHVWLSPRLAIYQVKKIAAVLIKLYPGHKQRFLQNTADFLKELRALNAHIKEQLEPFKNQAILVSHPAFAYFCQDFRLLQLAVECDGKEPRPQDILTLLQQAEAHTVRCVFLQTGYNNKGAELIAQKLNLPTHLVNPYARNYEENLLQICNFIAE